MAYDYRAAYQNAMEEVQARAHKAIEKVMPDVYRDWLSLIEQHVKEIFEASVDLFYYSYSPEYYQRSFSLYNLLKTELGDDYLDIWFEPEAMTHFRSGYGGEDGLYDQVFRKGWHGGADHGDYYSSYSPGEEDSGYKIIINKHPSPGIPYYRTPLQYYRYWGKPAAIAATPPLDIYRNAVDEYQHDQGGIYADYYTAWNRNAHKINFNI